MIPETLEGWTIATVTTLVESGLSENDLFDLKEDLQPANHQRKVVAAFANTSGGFLIFGVKNSGEIVGVENKELPRDFAVKLKHGLSPSIDYQFGPPIQLGGNRRIYICHIPVSKRRPHAVIEHESCMFLKRTQAGTNQSMSYEEIRESFNAAGALRSQLLLVLSEIERMQRLGERLNVTAASTSEGFLLQLRTIRYDSSVIRSLLPVIFSELGDDPELVKCIDFVRETADSADNSMAPFAMKLDPHELNLAQEMRVRQLTQNHAFQMHHATTESLRLLRQKVQ